MMLKSTLAMAGLTMLGIQAQAQTAAPESATKPYSILTTAQAEGSGGLDYVYAESESRRLYIPRGDQVLVFDLDTLKSVGNIPNARARGVAVDPASHHGFCSSSPVVMWDTTTLQTIKTIPVQGRPDGIDFEPATQRVYVFSHSAPNVTVIDAKEGTVVGTIDLGGAPEQAASDAKGRLYVDLEDKNKVAVVDVNAMKVVAQYDLGEKGEGPAGLGLDVKNHILFAFCHSRNCVTLNADDGKIITTLPIGNGCDGGGFNPATMEAFSSQGDGTLTIIKETSPTTFEVAQTVKTKSRAKTCSLDAKKNQIVLITTEPLPGAAPAAAPAAPAAPAGQPGGDRRGGPGGFGGRGNNGPSLLDIIVVGR